MRISADPKCLTDHHLKTTAGTTSQEHIISSVNSLEVSPDYKKDGSQLFGELDCFAAEAPGRDWVAHLRPSALRNRGRRAVSEIKTLENRSKNMDDAEHTHIFSHADSDLVEDEHFQGFYLPYLLLGSGYANGIQGLLRSFRRVAIIQGERILDFGGILSVGMPGQVKNS